MYISYVNTVAKACLFIVSFLDSLPKRKGVSGKYSTASHHGLAVLLKAKPLKLLVGLQ